MNDFFFGIGPIVAVQEAMGRAWIPVFDAVSLLGDSWGVILAVGLAFWLGGRRAGLILAGVVILQATVSIVLNQFISLPRPDDPRIWVREEVMLASFPSGHVFTTTVLWAGLAGLRLVPKWLAALAVVAEAFGRVYLGMHWVADVVAGAVFGMIVVAAYLWAVPRMVPWLRDRPRWIWDVVGAVAFVAAAGLFAWLSTDNHQVWETVGVGAGAAAGLPLAVRWTRREGWAAAARIAAGLAVIAAMFALTRVTGRDDPAILAGAAGLATLWAVALAPRVFAASPARAG